VNLVLETTPILVRPWRAGDEALLAEVQDDFSVASLYARFFTGTSRLPYGYLRYVARAWSQGQWDAVLAFWEGRLIGWAEYGRSASDPPELAELGVLVVDAWQRQRVGSTLVEALASRALRAGLTTLRAEVLETNWAARGLIRSRFGTFGSVEREGEVLHYLLPLARLSKTPALAISGTGQGPELAPSALRRPGAASGPQHRQGPADPAAEDGRERVAGHMRLAAW
jgi:GNAT superfamily N-acetyltransferase